MEWKPLNHPNESFNLVDFTSKVNQIVLAEDVELHLGWDLFGAEPFQSQISDL